MKFSVKILLGTSFIILLGFSVGGIVMLQHNFRFAYEKAIENATSKHIVNRYSLESNVRNAMENGQSYGEEMVKEFAGNMDHYGNEDTKIMVYKDIDTVWYTAIGNISNEIKQYMKQQTGTYDIYEQSGKHYLLMASEITLAKNTFYLLNQFDISDVFEERDRQVKECILMDIAIVACSIILVGILAHYLTRNVKKLSVLSTQIAKGDYGQRTNIHSSDEIGELSRNFDKMAQAVQEHIIQLEDEIQVREQFVSDFSHELKTPMTAMMGYSKMLLDTELDIAMQQKAADYIYRECRRLKSLSHALLQMLGMTEEVLECKEVYTDWIGERLAHICTQPQNVEIEYQIEETVIWTDPNLVLILLRNIVENAVRACERKETEQKERVVVKGEKREGAYYFTVVDTGCGIPKEDVKHITKAFYMVDKSRTRKQGGSGLGLSICERICEVLEIAMQIESEVGKGTKITLQMENRTDE